MISLLTLKIKLQETEPRFIKAMSDWLSECDNRTRRPAIIQALMRGTTAKYEEDMNIMLELATDSTSASFPWDCHCLWPLLFPVVAKRKADPIEKKDLLTIMLNGQDSKTGQTMSDRNIAHNVGSDTQTY